MMAVVPAVSVCPTCAVPVIVGAPVAGVFAAAETVAVAALVSVSVLLASSVKITVTLIVVPRSASTSVWVLAVAEAMFVSLLSVATRIHWYV